MHTPKLIHRLNQWAKEKPDQLALALPHPGSNATEFTWKSLVARVKNTTKTFQQAGVRRGDIVVIINPDVEHQVFGFFGSLFAGALPSIFSFPSLKQNNDSFWKTFSSAVELIGDCWVACPAGMAGLATAPGARLLSYGEITVSLDDLTGDLKPRIGYQDPLFLQFSSGTTGAKKGIAVTEEMFVSQVESNAKATGLRLDDVFINWLPLYHDLGLIGGFLFPLYHGLPAVILSTFDWLGQPLSLFKAINDYRGTITHLPNFAYQFMTKRIKNQELEGLDLSSLRAMISGGEPVRPQAHRDFFSAFGKSLGSRALFQAGYGTAECTLSVAKSRLGIPLTVDRVSQRQFIREHIAQPVEDENDNYLEFCSCGFPLPGIDIRIAGGNKEGMVGEIEVRGKCVFNGYYKQSASALSGNGFFKTGDLGYLRNGELFVTGRSKDLIIHRGVNIYPTDVEEILNSLPGVKKGRVVVFGVLDEGTEHIVAMVEEAKQKGNGEEKRGEKRERSLDLAEAKRVVFDRLGFRLKDIVVTEPGTLVKSTSGKLSRDRNRKLYLSQYSKKQPSKSRLQEDGMYTASPYLLFKKTETGISLFLNNGDNMTLPERIGLFLKGLQNTPRGGNFIARYLKSEGGQDYLPVLLDSGALFKSGIQEFYQGYSGMVLNRESSELVVSFRGGAFDVMGGVDVQDFIQGTGIGNHNLIMLRDPKKNWYLSGLSDEIKSFNDMICWLIGCRDAIRHIKKTHVVGHSAGAYAALRAAHALKASTVWAFSPVNPRGNSKEAIANYLNDSNGVTTYHVWYGAGNSQDTGVVDSIRGFDGVNLHPVDTREHWVIRELWRRGQIPTLLQPPANGAGSRNQEDALSLNFLVTMLQCYMEPGIQLTADTPLDYLFDSLLLTQIIGEIQDRFGMNFSLSEITGPDLETPRSLFQALSRLKARHLLRVKSTVDPIPSSVFNL
ncbi:MAG: non-ribosomal peptide synthetase [Pseudomonadales bacterium]|nr:non-ribosomal peptide synthetase [Pseudomonadales bacterium]